ncbi:hypothetical protein [Flavobacterium sp.]|uniref:hypothetical protein n=1 Tax=Flavobacterium sp. TaxID=239 RepID=UPI003D2E912C
MESRLIFEADKTYKDKIEWIKPSEASESEWVYLNFVDSLNEKVFVGLINEYLNSDILYIVISRKNSFEIKKENIISEVKEYLENVDFTIWNQEFNKVIEFNKIDIYRKGIIPF